MKQSLISPFREELEQEKALSQIRDYYSTFTPYSRQGMKNRILKIQLIDNTWKQFFNIKNGEQLRCILMRYAPINAYCSITQWLNPKNVEHPSYISDRIPLDSELWIEVDKTNSNEPAKEIVKIHKYLKDRYEFNRSIISGQGAYLYYNMPYSKISNPTKRLEYYNQIRYNLIHELYNQGFKIDAWLNIKGKLQSPCLDNFRVTRLENSIRLNGLICKEFNISHPPEMGTTPNDHITTQHKKGGEQRPGVISPYHFITNKANMNNYITHIRIHKHNFNIDRLEYIINQYNLSDMYIFEDKDYYDCISLKLVSQRKLMKILRQAGATNINVFNKYSYSWIKIHTKYLWKLEGNNNCCVSKGHNWYLDWKGIPTGYKKLVGWEKPKLNWAYYNDL